MILYYISDIHLEIDPSIELNWLKPPSNGVLILAGDIGNPFDKHFIDLLDFVSPLYEKIFFIPGNHEYYNGRGIENTNQKILLMKERYDNFIPLINNSYIYQNVLFIGSTLWSYIPPSSGYLRYYNDFNKINLSVAEYNKLHHESVTYLTDAIEDNRTSVVITHHLPTHRMIHPIYKSNPLNYCFASHLDDLLKPNVKYWFCGHSHRRNIYKQCYSNPIGYPMERTFLRLLSKIIN